MHHALVNIREDLPDCDLCSWVTITEICCLSSNHSDQNCLDLSNLMCPQPKTHLPVQVDGAQRVSSDVNNVCHQQTVLNETLRLMYQ
jgi:hypothetical protein